MNPLILLLWCLLAVTAIAPAAADEPYRAPEAIADTTRVDADGAWRLFREGVPFVDVRLSADYRAGRIPGATNLTIMRDADDPRNRFTREQLLEVAGGRDRPVVLYSNEFDCWRTEAAIRRALEWGFDDLHYFPGGYPEWSRRDYPFE
ncbi:rhodanese-like domain-containing protein [Thioalkalivibrio sp. ALE19]|uniref:rhodanese-like domain-containing protein n=1 Tax=Thioalkalivibrio sp. ALE19 TaxID=1266909 RepID=UPI0005B4E40E|nr:rhodanese-like domain-containing protein [Thioalkalivibrio sp. ALE19]